MKPTNIIELNTYRTPHAATGIDLAAYERRGLRRYRRAGICAIVSTVADCLVSAVIGVCVVVSTLIFFTML